MKVINSKRLIDRKEEKFDIGHSIGTAWTYFVLAFHVSGDGEPNNLATLRSTQSKRTLLVRAQIFRVFWFSRSNGDDLQLWKLLLHRLRLRRGFQLNMPLITALRMIKSFKYRKAIRNWRRQAVCFSQINLNQLRLTKVERKICFHDCVYAQRCQSPTRKPPVYHQL